MLFFSRKEPERRRFRHGRQSLRLMEMQMKGWRCQMRTKAAAKVVGRRRTLQHSPHPRRDPGISVAWLNFLVKCMLQVRVVNLNTHSC